MRKIAQLCGVSMALVARLSPCQAHDIEQIEADIRLLSPDPSAALDLQQVASTYGLLGVEHILSGIDHLMFVVALTVLIGFQRQLVIGITGFTAAHSLTLALAALGLMRLPSAPIEAWIALSIVVVCAEALRPRDSMTRRFPFVVPFVIGLIHGLGFAGALSEVGLPVGYRAAALLSFNLGVEAGQLFVIGCVGLIVRLGAQFAWADRARAMVLSAFGSVAAYWTIERVWVLMTL
ncbi:MAG: HupE/UreJ family protein [Betaproteobacteria bacterium]|nr:HupE/UreJ family protein [Betaproteobacteria bacterium]